MKINRNALVKILLFLLSLLLSLLLIYITHHTSLSLALTSLGVLQYGIAFLAGIFFVYSITGSIGLVLLLLISHTVPIIGVTLFASIGAVFADLTIFGATRKVLSLQSHFHDGFAKQAKKLLAKSNQMKWFLIVLGIILYLSPVPDEIGMSILGISRITMKQFLIVTFLLNILIIFAFLHLLHI